MMRFQGAQFEPAPESLTIWNWLFEQVGDGERRHGFNDGSTRQRLSFETVRDCAALASTSLSRHHGVGSHDKVAIICRSSVWYAVAAFAAVRLGAAVAPLPHEAKTNDYAYFLEAVGPKAVFVDKSTVDLVRPACAKLNIRPDNVISLDGAVEGMKSLLALIEEGRAAGVRGQVSAWQLSESNKKTCAYLAFSSGTTGLPKAVMISHANIINQCLQMKQLQSGTDDTILAPLPFYHITGLVHFLHLPILLDQEIVLLARFDMSVMMEITVSYRCAELWLVPPLLIRMINERVAENYDLACVRQFNTGAAPLSPQVIDKLASAFPQVRLRQSWGMTESCSCLTTTPKELQTYSNGHKVGKLVPGTEIKVVDPATGEEKGYEEEGEIWARGPQVTMGYLENEKATRESYDQEGYLHTGDLGMIHRDGLISIHDRIKEMIKVKGHGVAPAELEDALHGHAQVADVCVIGVPDEYAGEVPKAFVVVKPGVPKTEETAQQLQKHVELLKARYMWLRGGVEYIAEIPKSPSGKILRRSLKDMEKERRAKRASKARM